MVSGRTDESGTTLQEVERSHITDTLRKTNWVIGGSRGAAAKLGLPRTTLISRMHKLRISRCEQDQSAGAPDRLEHQYQRETYAHAPGM
jgi:DNA-binding NtrC family response regulator